VQLLRKHLDLIHTVDKLKLIFFGKLCHSDNTVHCLVRLTGCSSSLKQLYNKTSYNACFGDVISPTDFPGLFTSSFVTSAVVWRCNWGLYLHFIDQYRLQTCILVSDGLAPVITKSCSNVGPA